MTDNEGRWEEKKNGKKEKEREGGMYEMWRGGIINRINRNKNGEKIERKDQRKQKKGGMKTGSNERRKNKRQMKKRRKSGNKGERSER